MIKKKTKIVATMGPSTHNKEVLNKMMDAGMNVCRINFSHGSHEDHLSIVNMIREIDKERNGHTAILGDLQGPKLRIGDVENGSFEVEKGDVIQQLDGARVSAPADIRIGMLDKLPGDKVALRVLRKQLLLNDQVLNFELILGGG